MDGFQEEKKTSPTLWQTARLNLSKEHEKNCDEYWDHILWSDETKIKFFGSDGVQHVWHEPGKDYYSEHIVLKVKHGGGSEMIWGCREQKVWG